MEYKNKTGYIFIKTETGYTKKVFDHFKTYDWVIGAWAVTGDYDLIVWVNAMNDTELYNYANMVRDLDHVHYTNSHYVYNGYVDNFMHFDNPHGMWVRLRADKLHTVPNYLKEYNFIGSWATIPGDYDYLIWTYGKDIRDTMDHVLTLTENRTNWRTYTHVPVYTYFNKTFEHTL